MNPREASVGTFQIVELRLLSDPEDSQSEDAHGEHQQAWSKCEESTAEIVLVWTDSASTRAEFHGKLE